MLTGVGKKMEMLTLYKGVSDYYYYLSKHSLQGRSRLFFLALSTLYLFALSACQHVSSQHKSCQQRQQMSARLRLAEEQS
jgi:hypothetical protein